MDLISAHGDDVFVYRDGRLMSRDVNGGEGRDIETPGPVVFMSGKYLVDSGKNFFVIEGSGLKRVLKLNKNIFCLLEHGDVIYLADGFGDVYRIRGGCCEYIFGTLSYPTGMVMYNGSIVIGDKYGRLRINTLDGKIVGYKYLGSIVSVICVCDFMIVINNECIILYDEKYVESRLFSFPENTKVVKAFAKGNNEFVVICLNCYFVFRVMDGIELVSCVEESVTDGVCNGDRFYKIRPDGIVVDSSSGEVFM